MARWGGIVPAVARIVCINYLGLLFLAGTSQTTVCGPCSVCKPTFHCSNGVVMDNCKCCEVCAKQTNETCGGPGEIYGKCDEKRNLKCFLSQEFGQPIKEDAPGICKASSPTTEKPCTSFTCFNSYLFNCPLDSTRVAIHDASSADCCINASIASCTCNTTSCPALSCPMGDVPHLIQPAMGTPGLCCNITECRPIDKCASIVCPQIKLDVAPCPVDSFIPASIISDDKCCEIQQRCTCFTYVCPPSNCATGLQVQILSKGDGLPGTCCDMFKCINASELVCVSEGHEYRDNETWSVDKCTHCMCKKGLKFCQEDRCPLMTTCDWSEMVEGNCCPVCKGCLSTESGVIYNNSDTWQENKCTRCVCRSGQAACVSETCQVKCAQPRYHPNRCCPICDEEGRLSYTAPPSHCDTEIKCSRACPGGRRLDASGCLMCACKAKNCGLRCKHGLVQDTQGNEMCRCNKPVHICEALIGCNKDCIYGFRKSRYGCNKCRCNKCPMFHCTKKCSHGFVQNDKLCEICKCRDSNAAMPRKHQGPQEHICLSDSGLLHEDGESWHDGCRRCFCHSGKEMCYLIRCAALFCANPVFKDGDCCPSCPGVVGSKTKRPMLEQCRSVDGQHFTEGETWQMDKCTKCICHEGLILCETHVCQPLLCHYPVKHASQCCPTCDAKPNDSLGSEIKPRSCFVSGRVSYKHGSVWRVNPCQSCACHGGVVHCYSQMCAPLKCPRITLRKGQCCPTCLDENKTVPCEYGGNVYSVGEEWQHQCSMCACLEGGISECVNISCPLLKCFILVRKPGTCCPVCLEDSGYSMPARFYPSHSHTGTLNPVAGHNSPAHNHMLTIAVLSVLFCVAVVTLLVLVVIWLRCRRSFHAPAGVLADFSARPKSAGGELHHNATFLQNIKPFSKYENTQVVENGDQFSELLSSGEKWHDSTTDTSLSSSA